LRSGTGLGSALVKAGETFMLTTFKDGLFLLSL
jgi:hypothetical protein